MEKIGRYQNKSSLKQKRKKLRYEPTEAEMQLWKYLRSKQFGVKFRRQYNIDYYIVDFYSHEVRLVIELDGWIHGEEEYRKKDIIRDKYLERKGYKVLRYRNEQVMYELKAVLQDIYNNIQELKL